MVGGPNGSGKSTLLEHISQLAALEHFNLGFVQNPDAIQREIVEAKRLYLGTWGIRTSEPEFTAFVRRHTLFSRIGADIPRISGEAMVFTNVERIGYLIPIVCDFFRSRWIASGESFTFETVMSGADKLDVLKLAKRHHYRTYLYYICTDDVSINEARIANRVVQGGHSVPAEKVPSRYKRSLGQLADAIGTVDRGYIFDNSGKEHRLIAEFQNGRVVELYEDPLPRWFVEAVWKKPTRRRKSR